MSELTLTGTLSIAETATLKQQLDELLSQQEPVTLHCEQLDYVDGCAVQLLLAFALEMRRLQLTLTFKGRCDALTEGLTLMALSPDFEPIINE